MNRKYMLGAVAVLTAGSFPAASYATPVTRTFTGTLTFADGGPVTFTTFSFGFTYDPVDGLTDHKVDYFTTSTDYPAFDGSNVYVDYTGEGFTIDGAGGGGLYNTQPDFFISAYDNTAMPGSPPTSYRVAGYTTGDGDTLYFASLGTLVETTNVSAAPEPASWAMLISGFGLIGGALRRRPVAVMA